MKHILTLSAVVVLVVTSFFISCTDDNFKVQPNPVTLDLETPASLTKQAALGRILFYDTKLSVNNSISCASCHQQAYGFGDNVQHSRGFQNHLTSRNSIAIQNLTNSGGITLPVSASLFWDGRADLLSTMVFMPVTNHVEMGMDDVDALVERVRNIPYYQDLFREAYPTQDIRASYISDALTSFLQHLQTNQSRFVLSSLGHQVLSAVELQGKELFFNKYNCSTCHAANFYPFGSGVNTFMNIGLDTYSSDPGFAAVSGNPQDHGKFKVPQLGNIMLTAPYMHDGRFQTIDEVLDHYSHGIKGASNLAEELKDASGAPLNMNITPEDKVALKAFLNTFTDYAMITNKDLASPFK